MSPLALWATDEILTFARARAEHYRASAALCDAPADKQHWRDLADVFDRHADKLAAAIRDSNSNRSAA